MSAYPRIAKRGNTTTSGQSTPGTGIPHSQFTVSSPNHHHTNSQSSRNRQVHESPSISNITNKSISPISSDLTNTSFERHVSSSHTSKISPFGHPVTSATDEIIGKPFLNLTSTEPTTSLRFFNKIDPSKTTSTKPSNVPKINKSVVLKRSIISSQNVTADRYKSTRDTQTSSSYRPKDSIPSNSRVSSISKGPNTNATMKTPFAHDDENVAQKQTSHRSAPDPSTHSPSILSGSIYNEPSHPLKSTLTSSSKERLDKRGTLVEQSPEVGYPGEFQLQSTSVSSSFSPLQPEVPQSPHPNRRRLLSPLGPHSDGIAKKVTDTSPIITPIRLPANSINDSHNNSYSFDEYPTERSIVSNHDANRSNNTIGNSESGTIVNINHRPSSNDPSEVSNPIKPGNKRGITSLTGSSFENSTNDDPMIRATMADEPDKKFDVGNTTTEFNPETGHTTKRTILSRKIVKQQNVKVIVKDKNGKVIVEKSVDAATALGNTSHKPKKSATPTQPRKSKTQPWEIYDSICPQPKPPLYDHHEHLGSWMYVDDSIDIVPLTAPAHELYHDMRNMVDIEKASMGFDAAIKDLVSIIKHSKFDKSLHRSNVHHPGGIPERKPSDESLFCRFTNTEGVLLMERLGTHYVEPDLKKVKISRNYSLPISKALECIGEHIPIQQKRVSFANVTPQTADASPEQSIPQIHNRDGSQQCAIRRQTTLCSVVMYDDPLADDSTDEGRDYTSEEEREDSVQEPSFVQKAPSLSFTRYTNGSSKIRINPLAANPQTLRNTD